MFITLSSCDVNEPKKDKPKPEGYQEDIPWPSLADSPWPMYHHDPQSSGRSKFIGPSSGLIEWEYRNKNKYLVSGIIVDKDSGIYAAYENDGLIILNYKGEEINKISIGATASSSTPIITKNGDIIFFTLDGVYSVTKNANTNWKYIDQGQKNMGANIDKEGNIFYINREKHKLIELSNEGKVLWEYYDKKFNTNSIITISTDAKYLYICSSGYLFSLDIEAKLKIWEYQNVTSEWNILDSQGNIYFIEQDKSIKNRYSFTSLNKSAKLRWKFEFSAPDEHSLDFQQATIDKNGNLYFGADTLFSVTFKGKLRWKYALTGKVLTPLVCDNYNIFMIDFNQPGSFNLTKINTVGNVVFEIKNIRSDFGSSPALSYNKLIIPSGNDETIYSIK